MDERFIFSLRGQEEFKEAVRWYEESKSGLGKDLEKEVWIKLTILLNIQIVILFIRVIIEKH